MPLTLQPYLLKDVSLTLVKQGDAGPPVEYRCQLSAASLLPTAQTGGGNALETFCDTFSDAGGMATWVLQLAGFQALADATDFSVLSYNEEGELFDFLLTPIGGVISASNPGFEGVAAMVATQIGGTAKTWATWTADLPLSQKATMLTAPPVFA